MPQPHIFRFHNGRVNSIIDWKSSDRITTSNVKEVHDKSVTMSSSAGTSIPTPMARMFLFKTAFEIVAAQVRDNTLSTESIYAGLVSDTLDLLELLYKFGSDPAKFRYKKWVFENNDAAATFFGSTSNGHRLLAKSFEQAADQKPFNKRIEITLIFYKENEKEVLIGGTSPFTFVFTSPNFKRKLRDRKFKPVHGLVSNDILFDSKYLQLHERDAAFIKYVESLSNTQGIPEHFAGFAEYVAYSKKRHESKFEGRPDALQDIRITDTALIVAGISLRQITTAGQQATINDSSDFKLHLPEGSPYKQSGKTLTPLFLMDRMEQYGQYSSPSSMWTAQTRVLEIEYPENTVDAIMQRELPGLKIKYPFLSAFDFFEANIVKLSDYALNGERFVTLGENQNYLFPIKPLFFQFFTIELLNKYLRVDSAGDQITFTLTVPVFGPTKETRPIVCSKTYSLKSAIAYDGTLGIFPFTKAEDAELKFVNEYTVASYEKTNSEMELTRIKFYKKTGVDTVLSTPVVRSNYLENNTKSSYYQVPEGFDFLQVNFRSSNVNTGGIIIPKFKPVKNGGETFIYAIDFGTSNTHVEYGLVNTDSPKKQIAKSRPFEIGTADMQMFLLHKPKNDDYERSLGNVIDSARSITMREFVPFKIGPQDIQSVKFPFRTATCESSTFNASSANDRLFIDANIGFYIDEDVNARHVNYKTDLKWLLQKASTDQFNKNRVSVFAKELLLMIRTKVLLDGGDLRKLKLILSFPISMGPTLKGQLSTLFDNERKKVFGPDSLDFASPVTESIAPYYQLKSEDINIQVDPFCNIDVGGGTTDIVLTNPEGSTSNSLNCICASFKFAGRQLWSSGGNPFMLTDNGFLAYYKSFIKRTDPTLSASLEETFSNNSVKTEDVVGLLFSKPTYKFKDIFVDNPELKVVLLIHYAAILYYIARVSVYEDIKLPRTVSFSGKGSEYLNMMMPNDADLMGLTHRLLQIFSGKELRRDFQIKRSKKDPKVITAQGALYFAVEEVIDEVSNDWGAGLEQSSNSKEKTLVKREVMYMGFHNLSLEGKSLTYGDFETQPQLYTDIMNNQVEFFNLLFDNEEFNKVINKRLEIKDFGSYKDFFIPKDANVFDQGKLRDSFKSTIADYDPGELVTDSPFFFPLNYALTDFSKFLANKNIKS